MTARGKSNKKTGGPRKPNTGEAFSSEELQGLAARASTLDERFSGQYVPVHNSGDPSRADRLYNAWTKSVSGGDPALLKGILDYRGLDPDVLKSLFGDVELAPMQPAPEWINTFEWLFQSLQNDPGAEDIGPRDGEALLPYEQLFHPLVARARQIRDSKADSRWLTVISDLALTDLDRALLKPLTDICVRALNDKLNLTLYVASGGTDILSFGQDTDRTRNIERRVADFVANLRKDGLKAFFRDRPVLARLLSSVVAQWQSATLEFLERLHRDIPTEIAALADDVAPGRVVRLRTGLSDLHNGGRSVYEVTFENGFRVAYKPKDLGIDRAWAHLHRWLEKKEAPPSAGVPRVRVRDGYGWVEWLSPEPCSDLSEAREFFRRSGTTLCLIRVLQGNDFHFENIMARGPVPVPVDLETVMQARMKERTATAGAERAIQKAMGFLDDSVIPTGYLPGWFTIPGGAAVQMGGLDIHKMPTARTEGTGTPSQAKPKPTEKPHNVPSLNGEPLRVKDFEADLIAGYEAMFAFLSRHGAEMAETGGPLDAFEDVTFRPVLRPTRVYAMLQMRALGRNALTDGAAWSLHFDFLYQTSLTPDEDHPIAAVCGYERDCMSSHNIPFFTGTTTSCDVVCGDGTVIQDFFRAACLDEVRNRLRGLGQDLLHRDRLMIQQSLSITTTHETQNEPVAVPPNQALTPATDEQLVAAAIRLAGAIDQAAIRDGAGVTWLGLTPVTSDERTLQLSPLVPVFHTGTLGIGLFQAALFRVSGNDAYRDNALSSVAAAVDQANDPTKMRQVARLAPLGLGFGLGGMTFGLVALAKLLDDRRFVGAARTYAEGITQQRISECKEYGLLSGVAGAMTGLLALYRTDPDPVVAEQIRACGTHLLGNRTKTQFGGLAWRDRTWSLPLAGLMHGASGVALALTRAARALDAPAFSEAAQEGLDYERALFELCGGWPDLRDVADKDAVAEASCRCDYANGAAGIGIARMELAAVNGPSADITRDIGHAVKMLRDCPLTTSDELFAGNFGRLSFLARAARASKVRAIEHEVALQVASLLSMAEQSGKFQWRAGADKDNPGLFNGAAGVGMALLQLARPDDLPDILALANFEPEII